MSRLAAYVTLALGLAAICPVATAQESGIAPKLHPWGRFEPGTWKTIRVVTETLDPRGHVLSTSRTDTKTTLLEIGADGVTLEVQACMEVAGKRFQVEPQVIKQGFNGEALAADVTLKDLADGQFSVDGDKIPCKIQQWTLIGPSTRTTLTLHYSTKVAPYVLKRECIVADLEGKSITSQTDTEVLALDMPIRVLEELRSGSYVKTVHRNGKTAVTTLAMVVPDVPGGVVSHSSKEVDKEGRLVRRSTLELVDYNSDPDKDRTGLFRGKRASRRAKSPTRYGQ
jgi:hypothetical protein